MSASRPLNCFISSSAAAAREADHLAELLHSMGVETYRADVPAGREISREILTSLRAADFVCLIVGETSPSPNVAFETGLAIGLGKPVLALVTGSELPFDLAASVQFLSKQNHLCLDWVSNRRQSLYLRRNLKDY